MINIAIYARKSVESDKGESINNQIEECKRYAMANINVESGKRLEDELSFFEYKDEGYTGSNIFRPELNRLIDDIKRGTIDCLICYKLDRVSRSVSDFLDLHKTLEKHKVNFMSVKEKFDAVTPMGKAMLQITSVFSELERSTIAERIRDNKFELAKTDRWSGGKAPLGYRLKRIQTQNDDSKKKSKSVLELYDTEALLVVTMFQKYIKLKSMTKLQTFLLQNNYKTQNGKDFTTNQIRIILTNPSYVKADQRVREYYEKQGCNFYGNVNGENGLVTYGKTKATVTSEGKQGLDRLDKSKWIIAVSCHNGIISADDWLKVQLIIEENKGTFPNMGKSHTALLAGLIRCDCCDSPMKVFHGRYNKDGSKGYYYACKMRRNSKNVRCSNKNVRADEVDIAVINNIKGLSLDKHKFLTELKAQLIQEKKDIEIISPTAIKDEIKSRERKISRFMSMLEDDNAPVQELFGKINDLKAEINRLNTDLEDLTSKKVTANDFQTIINDVSALLDKTSLVDEMSFDEQKELIQALIAEVRWNKEKDNLSIEYVSSKKKREKLISLVFDNENSKNQVSSFSEPRCEVVWHSHKAFVA